MTPMFVQYLELKEKNKEHILFFRLGDFYEMFFEDAKLVSKELGLSLTSRDLSKKEGTKAPMCGVPHHSSDTYISRLVKKGYSIAICEQTEEANGKTLVPREVVRIITPGTILDENLLDSSKNNYIISLYKGKTGYGIATADITTGEFLGASFKNEEDRKIIDEIAKYSPSEIITNKNFDIKHIIQNIFNISPIIFHDTAFEYSNAYITLCDHFETKDLSKFGIDNCENIVCACGSLIEYLFSTQMTKQINITDIKKQTEEEFMLLDISSRNNLELTKTNKGDKKGSLLWVLDDTSTSMGARLLIKWINSPLLNISCINKRLDAVSTLVNSPISILEIREILSNIKDIERIFSKISNGKAGTTNLINLSESLKHLPSLKESIRYISCDMFREIYSDFDTLENIQNFIEEHIEIDSEYLIKPNINVELDAYKRAKTKGVDWLIEIEEKEKKSTGIKNLKIKYSKIFGYCIEVSNVNKSEIPKHYVRRQTLTNAERYITEELKAIEEKILGADEKIKQIENDIFKNIVLEISKYAIKFADISQKISTIDVLISFANISLKNSYVKPNIRKDYKIEIKDARHPVVENIKNDVFVPNDILIDKNSNIYVITGPNMAGKSTYMRSIALIILMAQIGSFVPAYSANISICDRIFTRVGASDDLATGQSTFMVEMNEVSNILKNATKQSLIILDEIGRGTSTYDGFCIAWSVLEYIQNEIGAKTLFATHYHELTKIEEKLNGVKNYSFSANEIDGNLVFSRKMIKGAANKSYGIQVAKLSGIPSVVIDRANDIMNKITNTNMKKNSNFLNFDNV
ncbi:MAG: DNA mismatch repair protein MutS [Defluviitaleaceae bacterium]|nr:DNA mismatch repair protein MutS [Defluviitaleaceae bacterium]